ncbi:MAG: hypothetical protein QOH23_1452 [Gaiellaceae bacterium]|nr:hypothetical protein [Gaiellaceae bacterium]
MSLSVSWDTGRIYRFRPWRRRPVPLVETAGEAVVGRIVDDVFQGCLVLLLRLDELRPVTAAEEMILATVLLVEGARVAAVQIPHARVQVRGGGLDDQVVVVSHQAARVQAPAVAPLDAPQEVEEDDVVFPVEHDRRPVVPPGDDVVVSPGHERSMWSSHPGDRSSAAGRFVRRAPFVSRPAPSSHVPGTRLGWRRRPVLGRVAARLVRVGLGGRVTRRLWSARGADAKGSSRGPAAAFAGTACPFASWRGSGRPRRRVRPTRSAPR